MPVALLSSQRALTAKVSPDSATQVPNMSSASVLDALMYACCDHIPPLRVNTYTAPDAERVLSAWLPPIPVAFPSSIMAPTATVLPSADSATLVPK